MQTVLRSFSNAARRPEPLKRTHKVLVAGGAGFIGSHLSELLSARGNRLQIVDDLSSGQRHNLPSSGNNVVFEQLTIGKAPVEDALSDHIASCDFVFHLADPVGVTHAHGDPIATATKIVLAGAQLVRLCARHNKPLLFVSSSEVYGLTTRFPTPEDVPLQLSAASRFSYGSAKLTVEHMVMGLHRTTAIPSWVVRLFNIAGPRQRPDVGVLAAFVDAAIRAEQLYIHGDGSQTRCFLHVQDAAEAIMRVAATERLMGCPVNIGATDSVSIVELARTVARHTERVAQLQYSSYGERFGRGFVPVMRRLPDTSLLRRCTGWTPRFTLDDIIQDSLQYATRLNEKLQSSGGR